MKKICLILVPLLLLNCKENKNVNNESLTSLFKIVFNSKNLNENKKEVNLLNSKILKSDSYYYKLIISDSLKNGKDYNFKIVSKTHTVQDINDLSICYKSRDSILINNLVEKQEYLNKYLESIELNREEIFMEFSIESSKSGYMSIIEWRKSISLLKDILKTITEKQIKNKTNKPFRILVIFKADCYLQPGPPPP